LIREDFVRIVLAGPEMQKEVQNLREENRSLGLEVSKLQHENQWLQTTIQSTKEYNERLPTEVSSILRAGL
jgi:FtsZ-binding cell division protein ZapB